MDYTTLETDLRTYRPAGMEPLPAEFVWPRYEGLSVGNLAATTAQALGASLPGALPPLRADLLDGMLDGVRRVVLLVMDALGWEQLRWVMDHDPNLAFHRLATQGRLFPITTTFLSTTTSVLSTIWSGYASAQHGQLAYEMFLREWLMAVECITFSTTHEPFNSTLMRWGFTPETFQPTPALGMRLAEQGIPAFGVTFKSFVNSPLSRMNNRGMREVYGYSTASDFWVTLRRTLEAGRDLPKMLVTGYWSAVDTLAHAWGPFDDTGKAEIRALAWQLEEIFLKQLSAEDRKGTLVLLTADHGQIHTPTSVAVMMDQHPALRDALFTAPLGEARAPFFYVRHGQYQTAWDYLHENMAERFVFFSQEDLIRSGLLGPEPVYTEVRHRLGDIIGIAKKNSYLERFPATKANSKRLGGRHGGLHSQEMLVPLLALRLD